MQGRPDTPSKTIELQEGNKGSEGGVLMCLVHFRGEMDKFFSF